MLLALSAGAASAQPAHLGAWIQAGPAMTTLGPGAHAEGGVTFDGHVLALRGATTDPAPEGETWDVALLYGRALTTGRAHLWAGTGLAVTGGTRYTYLFGGGDGTPFDPMIGFPMEVHAAWAPIPFAAVGLHAFANVNTAHPFGGAGLSLRVGRFP